MSITQNEKNRQVAEQTFSRQSNFKKRQQLCNYGKLIKGDEDEYISRPRQVDTSTKTK